MKSPATLHKLFFVFIYFCLVSCDKGYQVRFVNYYIEPMDSVIIGESNLVFTNIGLESVTDYQKIKKGNYSVTCISKTKKKFQSAITIPKQGEGKRSIQIDGINSITVLED
ncbi:MAG TPA: hypothetical protein PL029_11610 [Bacteroidia bacterium]|nr:hypothetical protein [Bacteroidia bacterium]